MSDESSEPINEPDVISELRDEMQAEFTKLKEAFQSEIAEKDAAISELEKTNRELQRAIVRSAVTEPPKVEQPKTEEQIYNERIERLAKSTINKMEDY